MQQPSAFFLSKTTTSWYDRMLVKIGFKTIEFPIIVVFLISLTLTILSVIDKA
jgi:hypothetical protein